MIDIQVKNLTKFFVIGENLLEDLSFEIQEGERVAILGRNGCGKTTLFNILTGQMDYDSGEVYINPHKRLGLISQIPKFPVGYTVEDVLREAAATAACSHNHPFGIAAAQATALAIFLARKGQDKEDIRAEIEERFGYSLTDDLALLREDADKVGFDETWVSVPQAISAFLATDSFEECLRQTIALGCDADTQAAISCAIAEAYYGVEDSLMARVKSFLTPDLQEILTSFAKRFGV